MSSETKTRTSSAFRLIGYLMTVIASVLFGFNGSLSRLLFDDGITAVTLVEFRMLIGGVCLLSVLVVGRRKELRVPLRSWGWLIAFGFSLAMVTYTYFVAISRLAIAVALVIQFTATAWMTIGEALWRRRMPSTFVLIALGLTFGGVVLLTEVWHQRPGALDVLGFFYAVLALIAYIAYLLLGRRVGRDVPALTATTYGALVASFFWLCVQPPWAIPVSSWTPQRFPLIVLVGILGMAFPFTLTLAALRRIDATRVGIAGMLELVAAGIIAYFWLGQQLDFSQMVGCLLVLIGVSVLQMERQLK